jgi:hypothetical protein
MHYPPEEKPCPVEPNPPRDAVEVELEVDVKGWLETDGTDEPDGRIATDVAVGCCDRRVQVEPLLDEPQRE